MAALGVFEKLNLKNHREILVLNAPESFEAELRALKGVVIQRDAAGSGAIRFALVFTTRKAEVDAAAKRLSGRLEGDALLWFAYPKGTSRKYTCDFNRDTGWDGVGALGFEPVRQVALDEDWSALRFRRAEFIRSLRRAPGRALSAQGRKAVAESRKAGR